MLSAAPFPRVAWVRRVAVTALTALGTLALAGCRGDAPTEAGAARGPTVPALLSGAYGDPNERIYVFNARLGAIDYGDPNEQSAASGHLQIMLTRSFGDPEEFIASWRGLILNPARESFTACVWGSPDDRQVINLYGDPNEFGAFQIRFEGTATIGSALAARFIGSPDDFAALCATTALRGGAIAGAFLPEGPAEIER